MKGFTLVRADEPIPAHPLSIVIYGQAGIGKTSAAFTMPNPLHLDFDRGIARAYSGLRCDSIQIGNFGQFYEEVMHSGFENLVRNNGYKSIVIDTVGTLLDDFAAPYLIQINPKNGTKGGGLALQGWGALSVLFNTLKSRFQSLGLHLCMIAHDREVGEGDMAIKQPHVKGGSLDILNRTADLIGYFHMRGNERILDFNPTSNYIGKNVTGLDPIRVLKPTDPNYATMMSDIINVAHERMQEVSEAAVKARKVVEEIVGKIHNMQTLAQVTKLHKEVTDLPKTLQIQCKPHFKARIQEIGVEWDADKGKWSKVAQEALNEVDNA